MFELSGKGVEVYVVGEYLRDPVIELVDFVNSRLPTRRYRYLRIAPDGHGWAVRPTQAAPIVFDDDVPSSDRAFINDYTKELV